MRDPYPLSVRFVIIMTRLLAAMIVTCVTSIGTVAMAGTSLLHQTVGVDGVSAEVAVWGGLDVSREGYAVGATFRVAKGSAINVWCLTMNQDFHYKLTNSRGQIVPVDQKALEGMNISPSDLGIVGDCRAMPNEGRNFKVLMLLPLYPNLAPGTYTLHITFAPRGVSGRAELPAVQITVGNGRPPI